MARMKRQHYDDDGRTIANMNVPGMPWYVENSVKPSHEGGGSVPEQFRGRNRYAHIWGVIKACLLISSVFVAGLFLFILFCTKVWFA